MQAVILCAGKSTRTFPLTLTKPKPLLKIAGKAIIEHNLNELQGLIDEAIVVIGYKGELIKEKIGSSFGKIEIKYIEQKTQDGNGMALLLSKKILKEKFIVMNGDDIFSRKDIEKCLKHNYCILGKKVEDISRFGELSIKNGQLVDIKEKPKEKKQGIANTGFLVLDTKIFAHTLEKSERGEYEVIDYLKYLLKEGRKIACELSEGIWLPIGYPWNALSANEILMENLKDKKEGTIEKGATIKGPVSIGKNTLIKAGSYIEGPVIIGEGCVIGPNCFIRAKSSIGDNTKIGNAVEIKNSIIGDNTCIGHLSYVGDSIIGDDVNFGAGTVIANLRHDNANILSPVKGIMVDSGRRKLGAIIGDDVHTGINTSIYPGRKLWPGKTTRPGEIVEKDIE